jgi:hypothetical protein
MVTACTPGTVVDVPSAPTLVDRAADAPARESLSVTSEEGCHGTGRVSHALTGADLDKLATITPYATGATMKDRVNESLIHEIRHGRGPSPGPVLLMGRR